uniref:Uncharacterized protein n=1 Tax=Lepeophtheirus salmonis TaxID=72036 RepID=A0A0K2UCI5_LEPSM
MTVIYYFLTIILLNNSIFYSAEVIRIVMLYLLDTQCDFAHFFYCTIYLKSGSAMEKSI